MAAPGLIGSGNIGSTLACLAVNAGLDVVASNAELIASDRGAS